MKDFQREYPLFSLCGLNCGLCSMHVGGYCPGCGGGAGNQPCAIARCSRQRGGVEYCFQCGEYPCEKYDGIESYDSFITHSRQRKDLERARSLGLDAYKAELARKMELLEYLLQSCNDGRRKSFYCLAVNLLELQDVMSAVEQLKAAESGGLPLKERAALAMSLFQAAAEKRDVVLKLNKKTGK